MFYFALVISGLLYSKFHLVYNVVFHYIISGVAFLSLCFYVLLVQYFWSGLCYCISSSVISGLRSFTHSVYTIVVQYFSSAINVVFNHLLFLELGLSFCQFLQYFYSISHQVYDVVYHHHLFLELDLSLSHFMQYFCSISHQACDLVFHDLLCLELVCSPSPFIQYVYSVSHQLWLLYFIICWFWSLVLHSVSLYAIHVQYFSPNLWSCILLPFIFGVGSFTQYFYAVVLLYISLNWCCLSLFLELGLSLSQFMQYIYSISYQVCDVVYHHQFFLVSGLSLSQFMQ